MKHIRKQDAPSKEHMAFPRKGSTLHNLCILFSDNGTYLLDDADLDIVDDELEIDPWRRTRGQTAAAAAVLAVSVRNATKDTLKLQLFHYRKNKKVNKKKYTPFFR